MEEESCCWCDEGVPFCPPPYQKWHLLGKNSIATCFRLATKVKSEWIEYEHRVVDFDGVDLEDIT